MEYDSYIELNPRSFLLEDFLDLIVRTELGFCPKMATVLFGPNYDGDDLELRYRGAEVLDVIRGLPAISVALVSANSDTELEWGRYGSIQLTGTSASPNALISKVSRRDDFLGAACGDSGDRMLQSMSNMSHYKLHGRSTEGLPRVWDPVWEREIIDVSGNPGRDSGTAGIGLWPAADLWYAPACGEFMDFAAVRTLPVGEVTELSNGVLHVHLFDEDTPEPEVRRRQQALRDHLHFDDLEARADEINLALGKRGNPVE